MKKKMVQELKFGSSRWSLPSSENSHSFPPNIGHDSGHGSGHASTETASNHHRIHNKRDGNDSMTSMTVNRWRFSKPRQLAFWVKQSVQKVVPPTSDFDSFNVTDPFLMSFRNSIHEKKDKIPIIQIQQIDGDMDDNDIDENQNHNNNNNIRDSMRMEPSKSPSDLVDHMYSSCQNIDEAMNALYHHRLHRNSEEEEEECETKHVRHATHYPYYHPSDHHHNFEYDWILDGEPRNHLKMQDNMNDYDGPIINSSIAPELWTSIDRKRSISGDEALDLALADMELETISQGPFFVPQHASSSQKIFPQSYEPPELKLAVGVSSSIEDNECDKKKEEEEEDYKHDHHAVIDVIHHLPFHDSLSQASDLSDTDGMNDVPSMMDIMNMTLNHFVVDDYKKYIVPDFLPYQDPSTPEGAFFRRLQSEQDISNQYHKDMMMSPHGIHGLSEDYFHQESDPLLSILMDAPWDDITLLSDSPTTSGCQMEAYLLDQLSSLDVASKDLQDQYLKEIQNKNTQIANAMDIIHTTNWDISTALSYTHQLIAYIHQIQGDEQREGGIQGSKSILWQATERDRCQRLDDLLCDIQEFMTTESSIFQFCDSFTSNILKNSDGILPLLERCQSMKSRLLCDTRFQKLSCLDDARSRISHILGYIRKKMDDELMVLIFQKCKNFNFDTDPWNDYHLSDYSVLFNARMTIAEFQNKANDEGKDSPFHETKEEVHWSECILEAFEFEADRCLAKALLNPTKLPTDTKGDSIFHENIEKMEEEIYDIQVFQENAPSLRNIVKNLISVRFEFDLQQKATPKIFHSLCAYLASVMHSYHMMTEWHRILSNSALKRCNSDSFHSSSPFDQIHGNLQKIQMEALNVDNSTKSTLPTKDSEPSSGELFSPLNTPNADSSNLNLDYSISCQFPDIAREIYKDLSEARSKFWTVCRLVIRNLLEAIIEVEGKVNTSESPTKWSQELQSFHCIYTICKQMDLLAKEFIGSQDDCYVSLINPYIDDHSDKNSNVFSSLRSLFNAFVRKAHVESMTEIGMMMSTEEWNLLPIHFTIRSDSEEHIKQYLSSYLQTVVSTQLSESLDKSLDYLYRNHFVSQKPNGVLSSSMCVNPFTPIVAGGYKTDSRRLNEFECKDEFSALYDRVSNYMTVGDSFELMLGTNTILHGILRWTVRLIEVQNKLPLVADHVSNILCNIYDLYFLTVFRLCCGSSKSESILLGASTRSDFAFNERFPIDLFPNKRQARSLGVAFSSSRREGPLISNYCNEDINAPLLHEQSQISDLRNFITRGQKDLCNMVKLEQVEKWPFVGSKGDKIESSEYIGTALTKRLAAASSCLLATCILDIFMTHVHDFDKNMILKNYHSNLLGVILPMKDVMFRIAATRAICGRNVVMNIITIGDRFSDCKLNSHSNAYIDTLSDHVIHLWQMLASSSFRIIPKFVHNVWEHIVDAGFRSLLEGFSKIYDCSTEGRALMSIDLATFSSNMSKRNLDDHVNSDCIPAITVSPRYGMQYVDMYIKVFYFPEEDVLLWIQDNMHKYHLAHLLTLVSFGCHNQMSPSDLQRIVQRRQRVKSWHDVSVSNHLESL